MNLARRSAVNDSHSQKNKWNTLYQPAAVSSPFPPSIIGNTSILATPLPTDWRQIFVHPLASFPVCLSTGQPALAIPVGFTLSVPIIQQTWRVDCQRLHSEAMTFQVPISQIYNDDYTRNYLAAVQDQSFLPGEATFLLLCNQIGLNDAIGNVYLENRSYLEGIDDLMVTLSKIEMRHRS